MRNAIQFHQTVHDELKAIVSHSLIWFTLANQDIKLRYRRSYLGPFWLTLSMMITIYSMGFLYAHLFKMNLATYFPYLASGIICWAFVSSLILESSNVFIESEGYIRNTEIFLSVFNMRLILRNFLIFLHNLLAFIPIILILNTSIGWHTLLLIPFIFLIVVNAIFWGSFLGIMGTRYRDFSQILTSLVQVIFFLTPIMWMPESLQGKNQWMIDYNPFYHFLNLLRSPLLNKGITMLDFSFVVFFTILGFLLYSYFLKKYKYAVVFWL